MPEHVLLGLSFLPKALSVLGVGVPDFVFSPEKNIAGIKSQVLILGSIDNEGRVTLVHPSQKAENGLPIA